MQQTVVLYTWMAMGHLNPMVELAKLFVQHGFSVTIAIIDAPKSTKSSDTIHRLSVSNPSISFHLLSPPPPTSNPNSSAIVDPAIAVFDSLRATNPTLLAFLRSIPSVHALVVDFFCTDALDIGRELGIPTYFFYTSSAADLAVFLHFPVFHAKTTESFKDMGNTLLYFPGVCPIPASHMAEVILDRNSAMYKELLHHFERFPKADGILVNALEWLESKAVKAMKDGLCIPGQTMPPIYCVGPLVGGEKGGERKHPCLAWLDAQPKSSVVFLCFGSAGSFSVEQLKEIAFGLEKSAQRFLWVIKSPLPPTDNLMKRFESRPEPELEELLPEGLLERTKEQGMVVKSWAPQMEVLQHEAVGAFVSHCGWNSSLEAITAGVPMVCWPLYAEQKMNKVFLVEDMKVGVEMKGYDKELVKAEEVAAKVTMVMQSEEGKALRKRMLVVKEKAAEALREGGPSYAAFLEFLRDIKHEKAEATGLV